MLYYGFLGVKAGDDIARPRVKAAHHEAMYAESRAQAREALTRFTSAEVSLQNFARRSKNQNAASVIVRRLIRIRSPLVFPFPARRRSRAD